MQHQMAQQRQAAVLVYIDQFWHEHHYAPSLRDIVAGCSISSTSVASDIVTRLQKAGHLTNQDGVARSVVPAWVHQALERDGDDTTGSTTAQHREECESQQCEAQLTLVTLCDMVLGEDAPDRSDDALIRAVGRLIRAVAAQPREETNP